MLCSQVLCRFWGFCWESGKLQLEWSCFPGLKTSNSRPQMCTGSMVYLATLQVPHVISEGWVESIRKPTIQPFHTHTHTHAPDCAGTSLRIPLGNMEQLGLSSIHSVTWWGVIFPLKVLILDQAPHHKITFKMLARFLQCRGAACSVLGVCMKGSKVSKIGYRLYRQ